MCSKVMYKRGGSEKGRGRRQRERERERERERWKERGRQDRDKETRTERKCRGGWGGGGVGIGHRVKDNKLIKVGPKQRDKQTGKVRRGLRYTRL